MALLVTVVKLKLISKHLSGTAVGQTPPYNSALIRLNNKARQSGKINKSPPWEPGNSALFLLPGNFYEQLWFKTATRLELIMNGKWINSINGNIFDI